MKCRCPYCQEVSEWGTGSNCPACAKAALPPRFYAPSNRASSKANARAEARSWQDATTPWFASGGMWRVFRPQSVYGRLVLWIGLVSILGAALYGPWQAPLATPEILDLARDNLGVLRTALRVFREDCGRFPSSAEGLSALAADPGVRGWRGPYVRNLRPDPWGHPFLYSESATGVRLLSSGPDGVAGTADDIDEEHSARRPAPRITEVRVGTEVQATPEPSSRVE